jgi:hypothetical protein
VHVADGGSEPGPDPAIRRRVADINPYCCVSVGEDVPRRIPQFVAEIPVAVDSSEVEANVAPGRCECGKGEAQRICDKSSLTR